MIPVEVITGLSFVAIKHFMKYSRSNTKSSSVSNLTYYFHVAITDTQTVFKVLTGRLTGLTHMGPTSSVPMSGVGGHSLTHSWS
jgi:hypothetical protein